MSQNSIPIFAKSRNLLDEFSPFTGMAENAKKLEQVAEEFSWGKGSVYCPELVEFLEEDKELQADLRYLLGAGRIRTCYSVYGKAVDQTEIEESRLFTDIENWEASSRKQSDEEGDTILDFLHKSGNESRQLLGILIASSHKVSGCIQTIADMQYFYKNTLI